MIDEGENEAFVAHRAGLSCILVPEKMVVAITHSQSEELVLEKRV
ncbi:hypothetical protein [Streptomyces tubercidicus]